MSKEQRMDTVLGPGSELEGTLVVKGSARLDGRFKGTVRVHGHLVVGKTGVVEGEITARSAVIAGNIHAKVDIAEKIEFESGARFRGEVTCKGLVVHEGVIFDGQCQMSRTGGSEGKKGG